MTVIMVGINIGSRKKKLENLKDGVNDFDVIITDKYVTGGKKKLHRYHKFVFVGSATMSCQNIIIILCSCFSKVI